MINVEFWKLWTVPQWDNFTIDDWFYFEIEPATTFFTLCLHGNTIIDNLSLSTPMINGINFDSTIQNGVVISAGIIKAESLGSINIINGVEDVGQNSTIC